MIYTLMVLEDKEMGIGVKVKEAPDDIERWGNHLETTIDHAIEDLDWYHLERFEAGEVSSASYQHAIKRVTSEEYGPRPYEEDEYDEENEAGWH